MPPARYSFPSRRPAIGNASGVDKRRRNTALAKYFVNPWMGLVAGTRLAPGYAILETTGRKSGEPRRTPVGNGLDGDTFWIVAEHGLKAGYVRNIEANPRVRVKIRGRWREGTAYPLPEDDWRARQRDLPSLNAAVVRLLGSDPMTVRIALD
jgi:deazaflavin-dependent oxidoreductase (nitroreductase family)